MARVDLIALVCCATASAASGAAALAVRWLLFGVRAPSELSKNIFFFQQIFLNREEYKLPSVIRRA
jgi:hypothetical protein